MVSPQAARHSTRPAASAASRKKNITTEVTLEARPSIPSVRFTALTQPTMTKAAKIRYTIQFTVTVTLTKGMYRSLVSRPSYRIRHRNTTAARSCKTNFCLAVRPSFWCWRTLR